MTRHRPSILRLEVFEERAVPARLLASASNLELSALVARVEITGDESPAKGPPAHAVAWGHHKKDKFLLSPKIDILPSDNTPPSHESADESPSNNTPPPSDKTPPPTATSEEPPATTSQPPATTNRPTRPNSGIVVKLTPITHDDDEGEPSGDTRDDRPVIIRRVPGVIKVDPVEIEPDDVLVIPHPDEPVERPAHPLVPGPTATTETPTEPVPVAGTFAIQAGDRFLRVIPTPAGRREASVFPEALLTAAETAIPEGETEVTPPAVTEMEQPNLAEDLADAVRSWAPPGIEVADLVSRFAPFDTETLQQAIDQFLNRLQQEPDAGWLSARQAGLIVTALAAGLTAGELARRKKLPLKAARFLTLTRLLSATRTT